MFPIMWTGMLYAKPTQEDEHLAFWFCNFPTHLCEVSAVVTLGGDGVGSWIDLYSALYKN